MYFHLHRLENNFKNLYTLESLVFKKYITSSARPTPGRTFRKRGYYRKKMSYRKAFEMKKQRSVEVVGAPTNEEMAAEMPMIRHERIHSQLTE